MSGKTISEKSNIALGFALTIGGVVFAFGIAWAQINRNAEDIKELQNIIPEVRERLSNIEGALGVKKNKKNEEE